jgi:hypothetical protein
MPVTTLLATGSLTASTTGTVLDLRNYVPNDIYTQLELRITAITSNELSSQLYLQFVNQGTPVSTAQYASGALVTDAFQTGALTFGGGGGTPPTPAGTKILSTEGDASLSDGSGTIILNGFCFSSTTVTPNVWMEILAQSTGGGTPYAGWANGLASCNNAAAAIFDGLNFVSNLGTFSFNWALYGITSVSEGSCLASCRVATTANLSATYSNGSSGVGATLTNSGTQAAISIDGVSLNSGDCVLVWNQTTQTQNGIYSVTTVGTGSTNWVLTRTAGFNSSSTIQPGATTYIQSGTAYAEANFQMTTAGTITVGTTNIVFSELGGGGGTITLTGDVTGSGTSSLATTIAANAVTNSKLAQMASHTYKGNNTGSTANAADITSTQLTADLNIFTSSLQGLAPGSGGGTSNFLRADGTWAAPSGGGGGTVAYSSIAGCLPSSIAGTHTTASMSISAGQAADSTNAAYITCAGYSWAASNGNAINGTDAASSTLGNNTTYHMFLCSGGSGTGTFCSASLTPTFPTGYATYSRRIFSFKTNSSGSPIPYTAIECEGGATINWLTTQVLDISATPTTSRTAYTVTVPGGIKVQWLYRISQSEEVSSNNDVIITSGDETDVAPNSVSGGSAPLSDGLGNTILIESIPRDGVVTTNTSGQIGIRCSEASNTTLYGVTRGWKDFRRS